MITYKSCIHLGCLFISRIYARAVNQPQPTRGNVTSNLVACTFSSFNNVLVLLCVIFLTYMCCPRLCSHGGWLLLKCSAIGIGFNGAETNCGIARILGILLMNSWDTQIYFLATTIICSLSTLNWSVRRSRKMRYQFHHRLTVRNCVIIYH